MNHKRKTEVRFHYTLEKILIIYQENLCVCVFIQTVQINSLKFHKSFNIYFFCFYVCMYVCMYVLLFKYSCLYFPPPFPLPNQPHLPPWNLLPLALCPYVLYTCSLMALPLLFSILKFYNEWTRNPSYFNSTHIKL